MDNATTGWHEVDGQWRRYYVSTDLAAQVAETMTGWHVCVWTPLQFPLLTATVTTPGEAGKALAIGIADTALGHDAQYGYFQVERGIPRAVVMAARGTDVPVPPGGKVSKMLPSQLRLYYAGKSLVAEVADSG